MLTALQDLTRVHLSNAVLTHDRSQPSVIQLWEQFSTRLYSFWPGSKSFGRTEELGFEIWVR